MSEEMVPRRCGHEELFAFRDNELFLPKRRADFSLKLCAACRQKEQEEAVAQELATAPKRRRFSLAYLKREQAKRYHNHLKRTGQALAKMLNVPRGAVVSIKHRGVTHEIRVPR